MRETFSALIRPLWRSVGSLLLLASERVLGPAASAAAAIGEAYTESDLVEAAIVDAALAAREYLNTPLLAQAVDLPMAGPHEAVTVATLPGRARGGRFVDKYRATETWREVRNELSYARIEFRRECPALSELPLAARRAIRRARGAADTLITSAHRLHELWSEIDVYTMSGDPANHVQRIHADMELLHAEIAHAVEALREATAVLEGIAEREAPELWAETRPSAPTDAREQARRRRALEELADIARAALDDGFSKDQLAHSTLRDRLPSVDLRAIAEADSFDFQQPQRQNGWLSMRNNLEGAIERFWQRSALKRDRVAPEVWAAAEQVVSGLREALTAASDVYGRVGILAGAGPEDQARLERELDDARRRFQEELQLAVRGVDAISAAAEQAYR